MNLNQKVAGLAGVGLSLVGVAAHAALPTDAAAAFTSISTNVTDTLAVVWPIVISLTSGFILIKLFKKGANKAV